jgi:plastocyanin
MLLLVFPVLATTTTNLAHGQNQTQVSNVTIVSDASAQGNKAYQPNPLEIHVGSKVIWTNNDFGIHTVTDSDGAFDSDVLTPQDTFEFAFDKAGTFDYYCALHPSMVGRIVVQ